MKPPDSFFPQFQKSGDERVFHEGKSCTFLGGFLLFVSIVAVPQDPPYFKV